MRSWAIRVVGGTADSITVLSEREKRNVERFSVSTSAAVVPNAIDLEQYKVLPDKVMETGHYHLGYLGRLVADKGIFHLIEAAELLRHSVFKFTLHIAGSGPCADDINKLITRLRLEKNVTLHGELWGHRKLKFWEQLHIFVLPSYHEGLPYVLLESLASGTPIVATAVGAIPEVITNDTHGLFVPVGDATAIAQAIEHMLKQPARLKKMSTACRRRALEHYDIKRLTRQFADLYSSLTSNTRTGIQRTPNKAKSRSTPPGASRQD